MTFKMYSSCIRTIRQDDDKFHIHDGMIISPRAGFEISQECPMSYRKVLAECIDQGWIKPVAHIKDSELVWETLQQ
jgi:hypothetical protein